MRHRATDVPVYDLHKPLKQLPRSKLRSLLRMFDIWDFRRVRSAAHASS
jgi:hypothetical protein